jgi:hypothetical protein
MSWRLEDIHRRERNPSKYQQRYSTPTNNIQGQNILNKEIVLPKYTSGLILSARTVLFLIPI